MKMNLLWGYVAGLLTLPLLAYAVAYSGRFPVATASRPLPLEVSLAKTALHYASHRQAPTLVPVVANASELAAAAKNYRAECAFCHGLPGQPKPAVAAGMFPPPPQFFQKVDDDAAGVIFWRIKNGIRLTGMPAFAPSLTDTEIWQESLLLQQAKQLPAAASAQLSCQVPGAGCQ